MSAGTAIDGLPRKASAPPNGGAAGWALWARQAVAIVRFELRRNFLGRRSILLYLLAALPVLLLLAFSLAPLEWREGPQIAHATGVYAAIYQGLTLRFVVYFGCVWLFTNLFRGEILDRSLHYYFLAPVRREVLVVGKFVAGLGGGALLFGGATLVSYLLLYLPYGTAGLRQHLLAGPGLGQVGAYVGVTLLACLGYGSLFLFLGLLLRNPILPAGVILVWEWINFLLPPVLKKLSVIHYLRSLDPLPASDGPFALVASPPPAWVSVAGLAVVAALMLALAGLRVRTMEVLYGD